MRAVILALMLATPASAQSVSLGFGQWANKRIAHDVIEAEARAYANRAYIAGTLGWDMHVREDVWAGTASVGYALMRQDRVEVDTAIGVRLDSYVGAGDQGAVEAHATVRARLAGPVWASGTYGVQPWLTKGERYLSVRVEWRGGVRSKRRDITPR